MSEATAYPECRHILPSGVKCHAPALRGRPVCYFHARQRTLVDQNRYRLNSLALPPLEDRGAIQIALNEVLAALADRKIDRRTAGAFLYAIQLASTNLELAARTPAPDLVTDLCRAERGDLLAPAGPVLDPEVDPAAHPLTFPAGSAAGDDTCYTFPEIELDGSPRSDEPPQPVRDEKPWHVSTQLPFTSNRGTHEYDQEPPPPPRKLTPQEQKLVEIISTNMNAHFEARDRRRALQEAAAAAGTTPEPDPAPSAKTKQKKAKART